MVESLDPAARRAAKSAGAFRTISEVAEELDVPQHVLRFWESKFTQVRPLKNMPIAAPVSEAGGEASAAPDAKRLREPDAAPARQAPSGKPDPELPPLLAAIERAA